ncbi:Ubiquitin-protein ligase E3A [Tritrichomonas musculus]|uniref:HECT-type E3 ubiquitin transferase n=1 Tax=Tritrichomonas musculus TaxID=1915356 RepID=A0ABR2HFL1_9EUKA
MSFQDKLAFYRRLVSENPPLEEKSSSSASIQTDGLQSSDANKTEVEEKKKKIEELTKQEEEKKRKVEEEKKKVEEEKKREEEEKRKIEEEKKKKEERQKIEEANNTRKNKNQDNNDNELKCSLDWDSFPYLCINKNTVLTEGDLQLSDIFITEHRNRKKKSDIDILQFNLMLTEVLSRQTSLFKIRSVLLIFVLKNSIDISPYFPTILTEDILLDNPKEELFCKSEHRYFNSIFYNELKKHPLLMLNVIEVIKEFISIHSLQFDSIYPLIANIIEANNDLAFPFDYKQLQFVELTDSNKKYENLIMNSFPLILPFKAKLDQYHKENNIIKHYYLPVDRNKVLDAVWSLELLKEKNFKLEVLFDNEPGVDSDSGLSREFIQLAFSELIKEEEDLFVLRDGYYYFKYHKEISDDLLKKYRCVGILLSMAILNSLPIPIRFPRFFYKKILNRELTVSDLISFDPDLYETAQYVMNNKMAKNEAKIDFVYYDRFYKYKIDLMNFREVTNSKDFQPRPITEDNKQSYIVKLKEWVFNRSISKAYRAFELGFQKIYHNRIFYDWFTIDEIDLIVSGYHDYNWSDLKNNAEYTCHYSDQSNVIQWFWSYFDKLDEDGKKNVLKFITGTSVIPPGGLKDVYIKINPSSKCLPTSHTCIQSLDLPEYKSYDELQKKCDLAFPYSEGYGLF